MPTCVERHLKNIKSIIVFRQRIVFIFDYISRIYSCLLRDRKVTFDQIEPVRAENAITFFLVLFKYTPIRTTMPPHKKNR